MVRNSYPVFNMAQIGHVPSILRSAPISAAPSPPGGPSGATKTSLLLLDFCSTDEDLEEDELELRLELDDPDLEERLSDDVTMIHLCGINE